MTDYSEEVIQPSNYSKLLENNEDESINPVIYLPENEQLNEISVQKASYVHANTRNLEKQMTSKSNRKKVDQPTTSVDTSSNAMSMKNASEIERNSVEEVMTDYPEEVIQPSKCSKPLENNEDVNIYLKKKPKRIQIKLVDDGLMTNKNPKEQGNLKNEQLNDISVQKVSSVKANTEKLEKQTTIKCKRKKVVTSVDTSSNVISMKTASETERNSIEGHQVQVDDGLMTNKNQNEQGNLENEQLNEISVQKVSSDKANTQHPEKKTTSKKRKTVDQPTVDTSSNVMSMKNVSEIERDSVEGRQLQNDAHKANEVDGTEKHKKKHQKKHSGSEKNVSNTPMNQQLAAIQKTVEQVDDVMPNGNVSDASNQEESINSTEIQNVDNQPASKLKAEKPNPSSSVDTCSKANNSENQQEVSLQEKPPTGSTKAKKLKNPPARKLKAKKLDMSPKSNVNEAQNDKEVSLHDNQPASKVKGKKIDLTLSKKSQDSERNVEVGNELQNAVQEIDLSQNGSKTAELNQIGQHEEHLDGQRKVKKSMLKKLTFSANGPSELEEHNSEPTEILSQEVQSTEIAKSGKPPPCQPVKNLEPKKRNLEVTRKKSKNGNSSVEGSPLQQCTTVKEPKKSHVENNKDVHKKSDQGHVFKTPLNKSRVEPLSALPEKKRVTATSGGLFGDLSSDSSDDEVERNGSSSSTRTPDDLSSSDSSEGESKGDVVESQASQGGGSAKDKANTDLSGLSLESVIRSSRRYKEAKLAASQSQLEDREPPEFFLTVLD